MPDLPIKPGDQGADGSTGDEFADTALAMHLGEIDTTAVHGEATTEQARSLVEDGVPIAPLPLPVVPPNQVN